MEDLIEGMTNAEGKVGCMRCDMSFVVYYEPEGDVQFCPSCGNRMDDENTKYFSDDED